MKKLTLAVLSVGVLAGIVFYLNRRQPLADSSAETVAEAVSAPANEAPLKTEPMLADHKQLNTSSAPAVAPVPVRQGTKPSPATTKAKLEAAMFNQTIDLLLSPQVSYGQKQGAWKQLLDNGKIDQAISELEQRVAANPQAAEYPAALAQAYFKKCGTLQDVREQAILAMQADKFLDAALNTDPFNWEARFTKAVALSHWPASMNKGGEVVQHFVTLIDQQETQTPQPHFADSYVLLGDQYVKSGQSEYARMVWERGAGLFPSHDGLKQKIAAGLAVRGQ